MVKKARVIGVAHLKGKSAKFGPLDTSWRNMFKVLVDSGWQKYKILKYWLGITAGITGEALHLGNEKHMQEWIKQIQELEKTHPDYSEALKGFLQIRDGIITILYLLSKPGVTALKFGGDNITKQEQVDVTDAPLYLNNNPEHDRRATPVNPYIKINSENYNNKKAWKNVQNIIEETGEKLQEINLTKYGVTDAFLKEQIITIKEVKEITGLIPPAEDESLPEYLDRIAFLAHRRKTIKWWLILLYRGKMADAYANIRTIITKYYWHYFTTIKKTKTPKALLKNLETNDTKRLERLTKLITETFSKNKDEFQAREGKQDADLIAKTIIHIKKEFKEDSIAYEMLDFLGDLRDLIILIIKLFTPEDVTYIADEKINRRQVRDRFEFLKKDLSEDAMVEYYNHFKKGIKQGIEGEKELQKIKELKKETEELSKIRKQAEQTLVKQVEPYLDFLAAILKTDLE